MKNIFKGIAIGIANVIPGVSGGTIAVLLGIYEWLLDGFGQLLSHPVRALKTLFPILLGIGLGVLISLFTIDYFLEVAPMPTTVFFVGLILGGFRPITKELPAKPWPFHYWGIVAVPILVVVGLPVLSLLSSGTPVVPSLNIWVLFFMGIIAAATMVIPGVSGSMVLLILGYYQPVIDLIASFLQALLSLNFQSLFATGIPLVGFAIGIVFGLVGISKLLAFLLKKFHGLTFLAIYGLLLGSPIAIILQLDLTQPHPWMIAASVVTLILGIYSAGKLSLIEKT